MQVKAKYAAIPGGGAMKPHINVYDPRLETHRQAITDNDRKEFGLNLQQVNFFKFSIFPSSTEVASCSCYECYKFQ